MKSLQMNAKDSVEFDRKFVREGPEFRCYNCGKWFTRLLYWTANNLTRNRNISCNSYVALFAQRRNMSEVISKIPVQDTRLFTKGITIMKI